MAGGGNRRQDQPSIGLSHASWRWRLRLGKDLLVGLLVAALAGKLLPARGFSGEGLTGPAEARAGGSAATARPRWRHRTCWADPVRGCP